MQMICAVLLAGVSLTAPTEVSAGVVLEEGALYGQLWPNDASNPAVQYTNGLAFLSHRDYPRVNFFMPGSSEGVPLYGSLNLEYILCGLNVAQPNVMSPRIDPCYLTRISDREAQLDWFPEDSSWDAKVTEVFRFGTTSTGLPAIDLTLTVSFKSLRWTSPDDIPPDVCPEHAWMALMNASYMAAVTRPDLHFIGVGPEGSGWIHIGPDDFQKDAPGVTVGYYFRPPRNADPAARNRNTDELTSKRYLVPFYFGEVDRDGQAPWDDSRIWLVMFDNTDVQFALWGSRDSQHSAAWDWQYTIWQPAPNAQYTMRMRLALMDRPATLAPIVREYNSFAAEMGRPPADRVPARTDWESLR